MKQLFCLLISICLSGTILAQVENAIIIKAGSSISEGVPFADLYLYPRFVKGKVYFKDGKTSDASLNLNRFLDEMQFLTPKGDTLTIDGEQLLKYVVIQQDSFYFDKGYIQLVRAGKQAKLAVKKGLRIIDKQKMGAYGMSNSASSINSFSSLYDGGRMYNLTVREEMVVARFTQYYIGNQNGTFVQANRKSLMGLFPKQESAIRKYLKENVIDFGKKEDLDKLLLFLDQL